MQRIALIAAPPLVVLGLGVAAVVVLRRRSGVRRRPSPPVTDRRSAALRQAASSTDRGVDLLVGYAERHEEELEARQGAVLHIDVGRLSVGQI